MPIPTLPDDCCTTSLLVATVKPKPSKEEVALVFREKPPFEALILVSLRYIEPVPVRSWPLIQRLLVIVDVPAPWMSSNPVRAALPLTERAV